MSKYFVILHVQTTMSGTIRHIALILFTICGLSIFAQSNGQNKETLDYIDKYKDIAMEQMIEYKIPASIKLAQAIVESSHGTSELARKSNNHFCIKCHKNWTGKKTYYDDDEKGECFRVYNTVEESFRDHAIFLTSGTRYASLFDLKITDYKGWANGLKKAGYATSPVYASVLIKIIEDYNLQQYDQMVVDKKFKPKKKHGDEKPEVKEEPKQETKQDAKPKKVSKKHAADNKGAVPVLDDCPVVEMTPDHHFIKENFGVKFVTTKDGDNLESLAKELKMSKKQLIKYNDLGNKTTFSEGEVLYIGPKRRKAPSGYYVHVIQQGETLSKVSRLYAVKLDRLYKMNGLDENSILQIGQEIRLR